MPDRAARRPIRSCPLTRRLALSRTASAALLAVGYRLDEITNDITRETPAAFEPSLDYVVVKIPRFAFEKFSDADPRLGTCGSTPRLRHSTSSSTVTGRAPE